MVRDAALRQIHPLPKVISRDTISNIVIQLWLHCSGMYGSLQHQGRLCRGICRFDPKGHDVIIPALHCSSHRKMHCQCHVPQLVGFNLLEHVRVTAIAVSCNPSIVHYVCTCGLGIGTFGTAETEAASTPTPTLCP